MIPPKPNQPLPLIIALAAVANTRTGTITVTQANNGAVLGCVSKNFFNGAQSRYQAISPADCLQVQLPAGAGTTVTRFSMLTTNGPDPNPAFPYFGAVQGRDNSNTDLSAGSYQYLYLVSAAAAVHGMLCVCVCMCVFAWLCL